MLDVAMLFLVVVFFALAIGYANLCRRLMAVPTEPDADS
jgi:preprotein translocase subunit SecG